jgi:hypothetical protein
MWVEHFSELANVRVMAVGVRGGAWKGTRNDEGTTREMRGQGGYARGRGDKEGVEGSRRACAKTRRDEEGRGTHARSRSRGRKDGREDGHEDKGTGVWMRSRSRPGGHEGTGASMRGCEHEHMRTSGHDIDEGGRGC